MLHTRLFDMHTPNTTHQMLHTRLFDMWQALTYSREEDAEVLELHFTDSLVARAILEVVEDARSEYEVA